MPEMSTPDQVLEDEIGNDRNSQTRYVMLAARDRSVPRPPLARRVRSTGAFVLRNEPGALFRVLGHFALRDVNVKHLLARPAAARRLPELNGAEENANHWDYVYVFDWESELSRAESETLIDTLRQTCSGFRILGQYPSFMDQKRFRTPEWQSTWDGSMVHTF